MKHRHHHLFSFLTGICILFLFANVQEGFSKPWPKRGPHRSSAAQNLKQKAKRTFGSAAILVKDQETGRCLLQKNPQLVKPIASITKLMTAMVVLDAQLDLDETISIEEDDVDALYGTRSRLPVGTELSRENVLLLALMASDNRCAHALGRTYPGGYKECVRAMNRKARALGLTNTQFEETTGLSSGNVSSARDLAKLLEVAYQYDVIRDFTTRKRATIFVGWSPVSFRNTNPLVRDSDWNIGLSKTGFTREAGTCLVMQAEVAKRPMLIVLLDSRNNRARIKDANRIRNWLESRRFSQSLSKG